MAKISVEDIEKNRAALEQEGNALNTVISGLFGDLGTDEFLDELRDNVEFNKSLENKLSELEKAGFDTDVKKLRGLLIEAMITQDEDYQFRRDTTGELDYVFERDTYGYMARLMRRVSQSWPARLVIDHRCYQLDEFAQVGDDETPGFTIRKKSRNEKVSKSERKEMDDWAEKIVNESFFKYESARPSMAAVLKAGYEDIFALNRLVFYTPLDKAGRPLKAILIDSAKIRQIMPEGITDNKWDRENAEGILNQTSKNKEKDKPYEYVIYSELTNKLGLRLTGNRIMFGKFLHTTDTDALFDVNSPLYHGLQQYSSLMSSFQYTAGQISSNQTPLGMLFLGAEEGSLSVKMLSRFKQALWAYIKYPEKRYRLPVFSASNEMKPSFINFLPSNKDVQYFEWMSFLITILCAHAGLDPAELNVASNKGMFENKGFMKEGPDGITKVSIELGRNAYLRIFVNTINDHNFIERMTGHDDWELSITGLRIDDKQRGIELTQKELATFKTLEEVRAEKDMPIPKDILEANPWMRIPGLGNPSFAQMYLQMMQMQMMQQQGGGGGEMGGEAPEGEGGEEDYSQYLEAEDEELIDQMEPEEGQGGGQGQAPQQAPQQAPVETENKSFEDIIIRIG